MQTPENGEKSPNPEELLKKAKALFGELYDEDIFNNLVKDTFSLYMTLGSLTKFLGKKTPEQKKAILENWIFTRKMDL